MAGDWLQGPYVYGIPVDGALGGGAHTCSLRPSPAPPTPTHTHAARNCASAALYSSYGYEKHDIATLFVVGFGASMVFGTFIGSLADKMGRKKMASVYCIVYLASCVTKHFSSYYVLLLGRVLGGIATSLVYSVFDSWMVSEHSARGFDPAWMSDTFSKAMVGNSIVAIVSGLVANYVAGMAELSDASGGSGFYMGGFTAPFDVAALFLTLCFLHIQASWSENYGSVDADAAVEMN